MTPRPGEGGTIKLDISVEISAEGGTIVRETSMDPVVGSDRAFAVDVPAMEDQPAAHFDFTVEEDTSVPARPL